MNGAFGQKTDSTKFTVTFEGIDNKYVSSTLNLDSVELELKKKNILLRLREDGFWLASIDSSIFKNDTCYVYGYQGQSYQSIKLIFNQSEQENNIYSKILKKGESPNKSLSEVDLNFNKILKYLEENGYPFANLKIDSTQFTSNILTLYSHIEKGQNITYDSLIVSPTNLIKPVFLSKYLNLNYGQLYNERDIQNTVIKIQRLPFLTLNSMNTSFQLKKAQVKLDLEHRKVNYFDGILGLIPGKEGEGVEVTGQLDLSIDNIFQSGKKIEVNWIKMDAESQQLHTSYFQL